MSAPIPALTMANLRTIMLRVTPTPATLSERRAILGVLKQTAVVEYFKKMHVRRPPAHLLSAHDAMLNQLVSRTPPTSSRSLPPPSWPRTSSREAPSSSTTSPISRPTRPPLPPPPPPRRPRRPRRA